jgi:hypothetical protein
VLAGHIVAHQHRCRALPQQTPLPVTDRSRHATHTQVVTVFLATFISGTLLNQLQRVLDHPASLLTVLGVGAPQTTSFFLLYLMFVALVVVPLRLLRPIGPTRWVRVKWCTWEGGARVQHMLEWSQEIRKITEPVTDISTCHNVRAASLLRRCSAASLAATDRRARSRLLQPQQLWFGAQLPNHSIVLLLGLVFCGINPLLPAGAAG